MNGKPYALSMVAALLIVTIAATIGCMVQVPSRGQDKPTIVNEQPKLIDDPALDLQHQKPREVTQAEYVGNVTDYEGRIFLFTLTRNGKEYSFLIVKSRDSNVAITQIRD